MLRHAAVLLLVVACGTSDDDPDDLDFDGFDSKADDGGAWTSVGRGVAYQQVNTGHAILIAYGGFSAKLGYTAGWASELVDARLGAHDVGHIYAVKGPADPGYAAREIANTKLRAHLRSIDTAGAPIYVVAHSSGSYVAHELLGQMYAAGEDALSRIAYANLDGGGSGLNEAIVESLADIAFVYARDPTLSSGLSQNSGTAIALGAAYASHGSAYEVVVPNTGCANAARWCLHDVVITHRPHNPSSFNLATDYTDFAGRAVTTEYFDRFLPQP